MSQFLLIITKYFVCVSMHSQWNSTKLCMLKLSVSTNFTVLMDTNVSQCSTC